MCSYVSYTPMSSILLKLLCSRDVFKFLPPPLNNTMHRRQDTRKFVRLLLDEMNFYDD